MRPEVKLHLWKAAQIFWFSELMACNAKIEAIILSSITLPLEAMT
jgi:hypothetical protein